MRWGFFYRGGGFWYAVLTVSGPEHRACWPRWWWGAEAAEARWRSWGSRRARYVGGGFGWQVQASSQRVTLSSTFGFAPRGFCGVHDAVGLFYRGGSFWYAVLTVSGQEHRVCWPRWWWGAEAAEARWRSWGSRRARIWLAGSGRFVRLRSAWILWGARCGGIFLPRRRCLVCSTDGKWTGASGVLAEVVVGRRGRGGSLALVGFAQSALSPQRISLIG